MAHGAHAPGHGGHGAMVGHSGGGHRAVPPGMHGGGNMKGGGHMRGGGHMKGGGGHMISGGHMKGMKGMRGGGHFNGMKGWQRFGRGHILPPHFRNRQFFVHNWQSFGWPAPMPGGNWVRYHDDALLIDGHGRVVDSRYGWDWDGRGEHRAYDDGGYDEGYAEGYGRDDYDDYGRDDDYAGGQHGGGYERDCRGDCGPVRHVPPPPPHPGYGYGSGYGSSYGYGAGCACGPVVVTETITTTAPVMETHTYYETVTEHRAAPRRHYRKPAVRHYSKPVVRRSVKPAYWAPAPRPGERG
jgi:Ni/Co efflux regulator RcnB